MLPKPLPAEPACACATIRRASRAVTALYDAALLPCGLRITQFAVLRTLARLGPLPVTQLAHEVTLDRSTMGRNLDPLERRGLVSLTRGESDARERRVTLTPAGVAAIADALPHWRRAQDQVAAVIAPAAIGRLAEQIGALSH